MANIPFTHQTISNGVTQASAGTMQTVFDAIRMIVDKSGYRSTYVLDADTVSGYGIGVIPTAASTNIDNLTKGGIYNFSNASGGGTYPSGASSGMVIMGQQADTSHPIQLWFDYNGSTAAPRMFVRAYGLGSWGAWKQIWNESSDGNGGQPPAPKPANSTSSTLGGNFHEVSGSSGNAVSFPNEGGSWVAVVWGFHASTFIVTASSAVVYGAGNTQIKAGVANIVWTGFCWKISA